MDNLDATIAKLKAAADATQEAAQAPELRRLSRRRRPCRNRRRGRSFVFRLRSSPRGVRRLLRRLVSDAGAAYALMSVTNAISSVIVVGALLSVGVAAVDSGSMVARVVGFLALILARSTSSRFLVTERMLAMYKKKG